MRHLSRFSGSGRLQIPHWIALSLASYVLLGGLVSFMGWPLDIPGLTDWDKDGIATQPNAAVLIMVIGAASILLEVGYRRAAAVAGMIVAMVALATLFEIFTGADLKIDTILMFHREWGQLGAPSPGRMGTPDCLAWALGGAGLMLSSCGSAARKM